MTEEFGRYQLIRKLATGGMAQIFLARQSGMEGFEKLLVIKRILPHLAGNDEFIKMFLDEARIAARLNHPNVVQIFDLGQIAEHFFIAMEYLHGDDARRVWKQADHTGKPLPVPLACRIVMDACAGLDYAHKKTNDRGEPLGIVHRDVSPQNIIVTFEGGVKVVDFGIAKAVDQSSVTRSGVVKGKYSYMSPEQAAGEKVDARTDQFALGIVLYELLTGERLFKRNNDLETLRAVEKCQVIPPSVGNPRIPSSLDPVVMRALSRDLSERYPDCLAFQLALDEWLVQNRQASSSAQLQAFLSDIYAERLAEEKSLGHPVWDEPSGPISASALDARLEKAREASNGARSRGTGPVRTPSVGGVGPRATSMQRPIGASGPPKPLPSPPRAIGNDGGDDQGKTISEISRGTGAEPPPRPRGPPPGRGLAIFAGASAVIGAAGIGVVAIHLSHARPAPPAVVPPPALVVATTPNPLPAPTPQTAETHLGEPGVMPPDLVKDPAPRPDHPRAERAVLDLDGPSSLHVQVDGRTVSLPAHESLAAGRHRLTLTDTAIDLHATEELELKGGETHHSLHVASGHVQVVVHPVDSYADVYLGGAKVGTTPMTPLELAEGDHQVTFKNPDLHKETTKSVHVTAGQAVHVDVRWDDQ